MSDFEEGQTLEIRYPFTRDVFNEYEEDEDGYSTREVPCWKPGIRYEQYGPEGEADAVADGLGNMLLTVVSIHKPGKYPERIFFVRQWRDPDGKEFGKTRLRITTTQAFRRLTLGYRFDYFLNGLEIEAA